MTSGGHDAMFPAPNHRLVSRRRFLQAGAALAAWPLLGHPPRALAQAPAKTTKVLDFTTGADVAKAEQEGEVVYYGHDGEAAIAALLEAFRKDFPKIKTNYVRLQTGALYAKITAERSANRYLVDVLQLSDISPAIDFKKKGGYESYHSPEYASYKPAYLSTPAGSFAWVGVTFAGISYNRSKVKPEQAPKTWKDILNPAFKDGISAKLATSGMQHAQWYMLRKLYGNDFWQEFAKQRPRPALRPPRQGRRSRVRARRVRRLHAVQGQGRGHRVRGASRRPARHPRHSRRGQSRSASRSGQALHGLGRLQSRPGRVPEHSAPPLRLAPQRCAAHADGEEAQRLQAALPLRLDGLPGEPRGLREGVEQHHGTLRGALPWRPRLGSGPGDRARASSVSSWGVALSSSSSTPSSISSRPR